LYPGVIPPEILDHIVALTMEGGGLRVGIELLKHAALSAETDARTMVTADAARRIPDPALE
jgi:cell division control protein 6